MTLAAWQKPALTADRVNAYGINVPRIPPTFVDDPSPAAAVLNELAHARLRITVDTDAVQLASPEDASADLLQRFAEHQAGMVKLLRPHIPPEEVQACTAWLREFGKPTQTIQHVRNSYDIKHLVERWHGHYIRNGAFIVAALNEGYTGVSDHHDRHNAQFNLSIAKWNEVERERQREERRKMGLGPRQKRERRQS